MNRIIVDIPENMIGDWQICKVTGDSSTIYSDAFERPMGGDEEPHGTYTFLTYRKNGKKMPVMQDTTHEYAEHQPLWDGATGDVLISGLGIGMVNHKLIEHPNVRSVTIVEKNQEVIDLVWNHCPKDDRFFIVRADIDTWIPPEGSHWDYAWFDTWIGDNSINDQHEYNQMLMNRYSPFCDKMEYWKKMG